MKTCISHFRPFSLCVAIAAAVACLSSALAEVTPIPVARDNSDLKSDPAVTRGVLENGMRYVIMPNPEPPNRVSLRLYVDAGSLMEEDDQRGLAHFLEHMAFNGTDNFPAGEMVEYFQRLGMGFGNHTNAHTSFNETVYKLEMPNTETATLDEGFRLLKDYANGMLLLKDEIEAERGIILSEKRNRDSADWRTFLEEFEASLPDALVSQRLPIGTEEVIKTAPRERFEAFYEKWYTTDRMAVVVVGDIEVADIQELIKKHLSDLAPPAADIPGPDMGSVSERGLTAHFHSEMEAGEVSVSIDAQRAHLTEEPVDNSQTRADRLRAGLASQIINRRLGIISKADESVINSGRAYSDDLYDLHIARYATISATCKPENWGAAIQLIEQELRRAVEHGFTDAELAEAKANVRSSYERAAQAMATRKSAALANEIVSRIGTRDVFTSPKDDLERVGAELEKVTAAECQQAWAEFWTDAPDVMVLVSGNLKLDGAEEKIVSAYQQSLKVAVEPPVEEADVAFAYTDIPEGGKVVERKEVEDLELTHVTLNNGIKVNLRPTEFEDDTIYVRVRFGAGKITEPKDQPGLALFASNAFSAGGLEAHDVEALDRLFAGKATTVGFSVDDDSFVLDGQTRASDVREQLLQLRAYLIAPGYRTEAATQLRRFLDQYYQNLKTTPDGAFDDKVERLIHSNDHRFGVPPQDELSARTMEEVKAWMAKPLADSYMEISAVGDFDREEMLQQLTEVFGSLPEREAEKPAYAELRSVKFPEGGIEKRYEFESQIPKAGVRVYWASEDIWNVQRTRRLSLLGSVFDDRLRVKLREELGDTYSPMAHNAPSEAYTGYGYFFAGDVVEPSQAEKVAGVIRGISDELASGNITEDEMERALKPRLTSIEEYRRTNRYWMSSVTDGSQERPEKLDWARTFVDDHKNMKLSELQQLAKKYLGSDKAISVIAAPKAGAPAKPE